MSEYLRHDFAQYTGTLGATGTVVPRSTQLDRDGLQAINCSHFNSVTLQLTGTWAGSIQLQFSNDGTNWNAWPTLQNSGGLLSTFTTNGIYSISVMGKYVRIQCTAYTSGTITANVVLSAAYTPYSNTNSFTISPLSTQGAVSSHHLISAATTNATSVTTTQTTINNAVFSNNGATVAYVKLYNKASAPTVGTDTPAATILVPINGTVVLGGGYAGTRFSLGVAYAITGGMAVADATAVAATQVSVHINYT